LSGAGLARAVMTTPLGSILFIEIAIEVSILVLGSSRVCDPAWG